MAHCSQSRENLIRSLLGRFQRSKVQTIRNRERLMEVSQIYCLSTLLSMKARRVMPTLENSLTKWSWPRNNHRSLIRGWTQIWEVFSNQTKDLRIMMTSIFKMLSQISNYLSSLSRRIQRICSSFLSHWQSIWSLKFLQVRFHNQLMIIWLKNFT